MYDICLYIGDFFCDIKWYTQEKGVIENLKFKIGNWEMRRRTKVDANFYCRIGFLCDVVLYKCGNDYIYICIWFSNMQNYLLYQKRIDNWRKCWTKAFMQCCTRGEQNDPVNTALFFRPIFVSSYIHYIHLHGYVLRQRLKKKSHLP